MSAVLDAGALLAIDRRDRRVGAMLRLLHDQRTPIRTSSGVVAQVWRNGAQQATLARTLAGVATIALDLDTAKRTGELLGRSRSSDAVDAHVASLVRPGDTLITSDPHNLTVLLAARTVTATIAQI